MVFFKIILFFIIFLFKINSKTCCCYKNNNSENNIIDNSKDDKKNSENIKEKEKEKNKDKYFKSNFKWHDNNCGIKTSLLGLMILFDNIPELYEYIKDENNIKYPRCKDYVKKIIKEIVNIRERYLKDEKLIDMVDFYKYCHDYLWNFYKSITDDELEDNVKLIQIYLQHPEFFIGINGEVLLLSIIQGANKDLNIKLFKEFRDKDLENHYYKNYLTDYSSAIRTHNLIEFLLKTVKNMNYENKNLILTFEFNGKKYVYVYKEYYNTGHSYNIKDLEINDQIISIYLGVTCGSIGHGCLIFRDKDNCKKWYFDCCNKVIEIDFEDVKNKNFQKILDIWTKKCNSYNYKFKEIYEVLYKK